MNKEASSDLEEGLLASQQGPTIKKFMIQVDPENQSFVGFRICKKCNDIKPPRTHHCSVCRKCVMRMDHHCPWTGNCIGLKNHKYFVCFCFWTIVACLHVALSSPLMCKYLRLQNGAEDAVFIEGHGPLNPLLASILSLSVSIGVTILFCMHLYFLRNNHTSVESGYLLMAGNPFLMSGADNMSQIMGPIKSRWFWPSMPSEEYIDSDGKLVPNPHYLNGL